MPTAAKSSHPENLILRTLSLGWRERCVTELALTPKIDVRKAKQ